jgi:hypothetical protein
LARLELLSPDSRLLDYSNQEKGVGNSYGAGEQAAHRAVPQPVHVVDAVGARGHAAHQRHQFRRWEGAGAVLRGGQPDVLAGQLGQTAPLGQPHHWLQSAVRDQVRVVERG